MIIKLWMKGRLNEEILNRKFRIPQSCDFGFRLTSSFKDWIESDFVKSLRIDSVEKKILQNKLMSEVDDILNEDDIFKKREKMSNLFRKISLILVLNN